MINHSNLIEYASFYGSVQIIKYLLLCKISLTESMYFYSIHSNNAEIINFEKIDSMSS